MHPFRTALAALALSLLLGACANVSERCTAQGYESGSPQFADCIAEQHAGPGAMRRRNCPLCKSGQGR